MVPVRKTDINKYAADRRGAKGSVSTGKSFFKVILKGLLTVLTFLLITCAIVSVSVFSYIYSLKDETVDYDLHKLQLNYTSFIYVNGAGDNKSKPVQYQSLYSSENRIWVDYDQIPQSMKDAIVAIEDKRFWDHGGVDWKRTFSAVANLFNVFGSTDSSNFGGSTITQQLIKNITGENEVSISRKLKEIFRAMNLEKKYSKEEILTAYLNVVNFGSGCNGVQSAANLYFGKNIQNCDIAECAAIAGITQNPSAYSPLVNQQKNKTRQQTVLAAMYSQGKITAKQYEDALEESEHMKFVGQKTENVVDESSVWNWYTDAMFEDVKQGLMKAYNCSSDKAIDMIYHGGLKIYSAMNSELQSDAEAVFNDGKTFPASYPNLQGGFVSMDYSGRVMAIVGGKGKKTSNRLFSLATDAKRQPGSTIKPIAVYGPAMNQGKITYSTILSDEPLSNWKAGKPGPNNADYVYHGNVTVEKALEQSYNAAAAQLCTAISPNTSFTFLQRKLNFTSLEPADNTVAAVAVGGMTEGITVQEMTAGFQIFGNGGKFYQPYTYYYVEDHDGNVILDNRKEVPTQALSSPTSSIMRKLLNNVIAHGTGYGAGITGWDIYGKTGTTDDNKDSWFIAGMPYAVAGIWTGYQNPTTLDLTERTVAKSVWKTIMTQYLKNKPHKDFVLDDSVVSAIYCKESGLLAHPGVCTQTGLGWYEKGNLPPTCNLPHAKPNSSSSAASSSSSGSIPDSSQPSDSSGTQSDSSSGEPTSSAGENSSSQPESSQQPPSSQSAGTVASISPGP